MSDEIQRLREAGLSFQRAAQTQAARAATGLEAAPGAPSPRPPARRSARWMLVPTLATLLLVAGVGVFMAWRYWPSGGTAPGGEPTAGGEPAGEVWAPPHAAGQPGAYTGIRLAPADPGVTVAANAPLVAYYYDYQCPYCAQLSPDLYPVLQELVDAGQAVVEFRAMTFLDSISDDESSTRAAEAAACADEAGQFGLAHELIFTEQPAVEGDGYSEDTLRGLLDGLSAAHLSKEGLKTVEPLSQETLDDYLACYDSGRAEAFVWQVDDAAGAAGVLGVPYVTVNGEDVTTGVFEDPETALRQAIADATAAPGAATTEAAADSPQPAAEESAEANYWLPNVAGMDQAAAAAALAEAGFANVVWVDQESTQTAGTVLDQDPIAYSAVPATTQITLYRAIPVGN